MDTIIIYKENQNLKESIQQIRFSQSRPYTLNFSISKQSLLKQLKADTKALLLYFTDQLTQKDRVFIQNIGHSCPELFVCLCSDASHALDAWKLDMFHFTEYPITGNSLKAAYQKYVRRIDTVQHTFSIKTEEGLITIPFKKLDYLKASGNYTSIHVKNHKPYFITKQLNQYMFLTEQDGSIKRLHRSYIFNMRNIKTVSKSSLQFYGNDAAVEISQALAIKVKKELLGKS
jgi:hypothetical protein